MEYTTCNWIWTCLLLSLVVKQASSFARVCYFTNWSQDRPEIVRFVPEDIDPFLCSHIVYAYAWLAGNQLVPTDPNDVSTNNTIGFYEQVTSLKEINPELKILLAVGGWNVGSLPFSNMVSTEKSRQEFINSTIQFLRHHKFDGIDLDWEFPGRRRGRVSDKENLNKLLIEMRNSFENESNQTGNEMLMMTAVVPPGRFFAHSGYDVPVVVNNLDFIHVMTYDYHGAWESKIGHPSPLYPRQDELGDEAMLNMEDSLLYWLSLGVPKEKLIASIAFYGRSYTLMNDRYHNVGDLDNGTGPMAKYTREPGFIAYYEICDLLNKGAIRYWHNEHYVPYLVNGSTWIGYDDAKSIELKMRLLKEMGIGGVMLWALDLDDFTGSFCNMGVSPLLTTVNLKLVDVKLNIDRNPFGISRVSNGSRNAFLNEVIDNQIGISNTTLFHKVNGSPSNVTKLPLDVMKMAELVFDVRDIIQHKQHTNISETDQPLRVDALNTTSKLQLSNNSGDENIVTFFPQDSMSSPTSILSSSLSASSESPIVVADKTLTSGLSLSSTTSKTLSTSNLSEGKQRSSFLDNMESDLVLESTSKAKSSKIIKLDPTHAKLRLTEKVHSGVFAPAISFSLDNRFPGEPVLSSSSSASSESTLVGADKTLTSGLSLSSTSSETLSKSNLAEGKQPSSFLDNMESDLVLESTSKAKSSKIIKLDPTHAKLQLTEKVQSGVFSPAISFSLDNWFQGGPILSSSSSASTESPLLGADQTLTSGLTLSSTSSKTLSKSNLAEGKQPSSFLDNMESDLVLESTSKAKSSKIIKSDPTHAKLRLTERVRSGVFAPAISFSLDNRFPGEPIVKDFKTKDSSRKLMIEKSFPFSENQEPNTLNAKISRGTTPSGLKDGKTSLINNMRPILPAIRPDQVHNLNDMEENNSTVDNIASTNNVILIDFNIPLPAKLKNKHPSNSSQVNHSKDNVSERLVKDEILKKLNDKNTKTIQNQIETFSNESFVHSSSQKYNNYSNDLNVTHSTKGMNTTKAEDKSTVDQGKQKDSLTGNPRIDQTKSGQKGTISETFSNGSLVDSSLQKGNNAINSTHSTQGKFKTNTEGKPTIIHGTQTDTLVADPRTEQIITDQTGTKSDNNSSTSESQKKPLAKLDAKKDITTLLREEMRHSEVMSDTAKRERAIDLVKLLKQKYPTKFKESSKSMVKAILKKVYQLDLKLKAMSYINSQKIIKTSPVRAKLRLQQRVGQAVFSPTVAEAQSQMTSGQNREKYSYNELGIKQ